MNLRIARKKIKNDVLLQLWMKHWYFSSQHNLACWLHENQLTEMGKLLYPLYKWADEYELMKIYEIAYKKYGIKYLQTYKVGIPYISRILVRGQKRRIIKNKAQLNKLKKKNNVSYSENKVSLVDIFNN